jgi:hypothetical protein
MLAYLIEFITYLIEYYNISYRILAYLMEYYNI